MGKVAEPKGPDDYFCYGIDETTSADGGLQHTPCFDDDCVTHPYPSIKVDDMGVVCNATVDRCEPARTKPSGERSDGLEG